MQKIVVLDGHTLNPDDMSWEPLQELGDVTVYPRTGPGDVIKRSENADALIINKIKMTREVIQALPRLSYIGLMATGFDNVNTEAARESGICVTNVPGYSTPSVAQHTFALILQLSNRVALHNQSVHEMEWVRSADFSYYKHPIPELYGKTIGLVGYGAISSSVEKIAHAFGMRILIASEHADKAEFGRIVSLEELFESSDIVSLHTALTPKTAGMVNAELIGRMKPAAWLINTARGGLINEKDLSDALHENRIAAAAVDVLSKEPPDEDNPLLTAPRCIITPHISWASVESRQRLMAALIENLKAFQAGERLNVIN
ncbi:D-2-hydroxyacid dehydrogenase [Fulvivirga sedimenti]|jgi:glycerate dehydrogenase|uniref:D-2-hydroxyacid dehydrogenase n=1 Tax=Fulvivirga sedimenti TaxID=2879465 RepID=A0A9X1HUM4_9BACT|nr:D-2-hydroxyacid dehydrogenase [Fulvivirga sedimenti]MCA6078609.1 D-2-hydroxyacid dehydrogenase [Fulvivirga sedimenti]